jgi:hypothetical protein
LPTEAKSRSPYRHCRRLSPPTITPSSPPVDREAADETESAAEPAGCSTRQRCRPQVTPPRTRTRCLTSRSAALVISTDLEVGATRCGAGHPPREQASRISHSPWCKSPTMPRQLAQWRLLGCCRRPMRPHGVAPRAPSKGPVVKPLPAPPPSHNHAAGRRPTRPRTDAALSPSKSIVGRHRNRSPLLSRVECREAAGSG